MSPELQDRFDALLQDAIDALPDHFQDALHELPVIVEDRPDPAMIADLRREGVLPPPEQPQSRDGNPREQPGDEDNSDTDDDLCGLHSGIAITEQSVNTAFELPPTIHIFREPIVRLAGGWEQPNADDEIYEEVRITLLHELGHHFGLDEDDLDELGYA
ncbi:MAG: metallopeptidase family protein [Phycisphaerales bacterium]|jgi:predicted Zn-dependent protease with MMP-like domain|nr:metallopeptidase family protein [Phycisphaeraceae bacterium]